MSPNITADRQASISRETRETKITIWINLDGSGEQRISTGIGFLDHMLAQLAFHGLFDVHLQAQGDLHVDYHHTVEDVALGLGEAFDQALGSRAGLVRMASFYASMDDSLARVVVDFSGRPYSVVRARWHSPHVGGIPTSLFIHFLEAFAIRARCNLHASVLYGLDDHHQVEAVFKALGKALSLASRIEPRRSGQIPSTKGTMND